MPIKRIVLTAAEVENLKPTVVGIDANRILVEWLAKRIVDQGQSLWDRLALLYPDIKLEDEYSKPSLQRPKDADWTLTYYIGPEIPDDAA